MQSRLLRPSRVRVLVLLWAEVTLLKHMHIVQRMPQGRQASFRTLDLARALGVRVQGEAAGPLRGGRRGHSHWLAQQAVGLIISLSPSTSRSLSVTRRLNRSLSNCLMKALLLLLLLRVTARLLRCWESLGERTQLKQN